MDWYSLTKFIHIAAAIAWLGGALSLVFLGVKAENASDSDQLVRIIRNMLALAQLVFVPGALIALLFGVIAAWLGGFYWQEWIVIGLVGFAITFLLGVAVMKPSGDRMIAQADKEGASPDVVRQGRRILQVAKFDMVMLFTIAAAMVFKPTLDNYIVITIMGAVVLGSAALFLGRFFRSATSTA